MKAYKHDYTFDDDGEEIPGEDGPYNLTDVIKKSIDSQDFYDGRNHEYVLDNLMDAFGRLIEVLTEKEVLDIGDINRIVYTNIVRLEDE